MVRKVWYKAIDPYYSDQVQTFIGSTWEDVEEQEYQFNQWLGREHPSGLRFIYETHTIYESDCDEISKEINQENYIRFQKQRRSSRDESTDA